MSSSIALHEISAGLLVDIDFGRAKVYTFNEVQLFSDLFSWVVPLMLYLKVIAKARVIYIFPYAISQQFHGFAFHISGSDPLGVHCCDRCEVCV